MFVLSSDYEGMSNALIEAMMMGLPCISTACTGSDELIEDGVSGLLVPLGDEDALAEAMGCLADDPALRSSLSEGARLRSLDFALEDVIRAWERIL
jgi:glycosyltransferase involved in cell wall biosynthesis